MTKVLIALTDNGEAIRTNNFLNDNGYLPYIVPDSSALISKITSSDFEILIIDVDIVEVSELNILKFIRERKPEIKVIIAASQEKINEAISLAKKDAFMHLTKPLNLNELKFIIDKAAAPVRSAAEKFVNEDFFGGKFIGKSEKIKKIIGIARKVAKSESNILITGETGTGKELLAREIYETSGRSGEPFVAVNCAAIPESLMESELFGYKKGAFTGAVGDKKGLIELSDNGTLFLDEIGDLGVNLQAKLLRVIEYKELRMLGDENLTKVNIRIIAATNQDLMELIKEKKFREDLFFRLNVIHINIPPLRQRKEDIPVLIRFFMEKYNKMFGKNIVGIDTKARTLLVYYNYPGNVRELDNIIQHAFVMSQSDTITIDDLPAYMQQVHPYHELTGHENEASDAGYDSELALPELEKKAILRAFEKYGKAHSRVAKALGISRSTLWRKMKDYKIGI